MNANSNYEVSLELLGHGLTAAAQIHAALAIADAITTSSREPAITIDSPGRGLDDGDRIDRAGWSVEYRRYAGVWVHGKDPGDDPVHLGQDADAIAELGRFLLDAAHSLHADDVMIDD